MHKLEMTDEWLKEMAQKEEGHDISAGPGDSAMEKLGIAKKDLVNELKEEYLKLRQDEALSSTKLAAADMDRRKQMEALQARIDELEGDSS